MKTLTARTPEDLLAMVPCVLGFHPEQSIVMLTFGDASSTFQARIDLPGCTEEIDDVVDCLLEPAEHHGVRTAVLVGYAPDTELVAETLIALTQELESAGVRVVEVLRVHDGRWFWGRPELSELAPEGIAFDLDDHEFIAESVFEGRVTHASREALADSLVGTDTQTTKLVEAAAFEAAGSWGRVQLAAEARWVRDVVVAHVSAHTVPTVQELGRLLVAIQEICLRDVAWAQVTRATATEHVAFWSEVVRRTPAGFIAPAASLLAFSAWLNGQGALAWCAVDRAILCEPDYSLAGLVGEALLRAVRPDTWTPPPGLDLLASS
ncbi:MAG TPA: DUF4192 domain-containing protein [Nocardioides sp.]